VLDDWGDGPNLLMVGFIKPHHPFDPPAGWADLYDPQALSPLPGWTEQAPDEARRGYFDYSTLTEPALRRVMALYYATISHIDHHVGQIVERLKAHGLYDNTLILYTSDHGEYLGFHHRLLKGGPMYDPLVRVPLIVKYPGAARAGERNDGLVSHVDLAPTLLAAAGVEAPAYWPGVDLGLDTAGREHVFAEDRRGAAYMARSRTGKLLCGPGPARRFFDLTADPLEMADRRDDPACRQRIADHEQALARWMLFETPTQPYLDEQAPRCDTANVPPLDDGHREESMAYFRRKMAETPDGLFEANA
jgi:arylsulfatase A-like enzyme